MKIKISSTDFRLADAASLVIARAAKRAGGWIRLGPIPLPTKAGRHRRLMRLNVTEPVMAEFGRLQLPDGIVVEIA